MRCNDCNKFVGQDIGEPEIESGPDLEGNSVTLDVRIHVDCADCGTELKEETFNMEGNFDQKLIDEHTGEGHELEVEADAEATDRYETKDKNGKPIKVRYQRHYYGAEVTVTLKCSCQEEKAEPLATLTLSDEVQAGGMNEL